MKPGDNFNLLVQYRHHFPEELRRHIRTARLFCFDMLPTESFDGLDADTVNEHMNTLCLPFPVTAIEDRVSCTILWDLEPGAVGVDKPRGIMEVARIENYLQDGAFEDGSISGEMIDDLKEWSKKQRLPVSVRWGHYW
ncbi:MAG: hypothetical protein GF411_14715 [Candidatus Lokiarchaeota archaeon]|nr:hypothetical protein [Candidatus Lokiarchaeota archaeon]